MQRRAYLGLGRCEFGRVTYGDVFHQKSGQSGNFEHADVPKMSEFFDFYEEQADKLVDAAYRALIDGVSSHALTCSMLAARFRSLSVSALFARANAVK